jgi:hypothetical protein
LSDLEPRKGMPSPRLNEEEFRRRFLGRFQDPAYDPLQAELDRIAAAAWDAYSQSRKSPHTRKAGPGFADPDYELSVDWITAREAIREAEHRHADPALPARILLVCGSPRSEHSCPGEMSKSFRLTELAREVFPRRTVSRRMCSTSAGWPRSTDGRSIPARRASRPPPPSATGPAPATRTIRSARSMTG